MRCVTWSRDSHGLFDYESRYITKRNLRTTGSGRIIRLDNDIEFLEEGQDMSIYGDEAKPLLRIKEVNGKDPHNLTTLGHFQVENDTLVDHLEGAQHDEDVNNRMFTVVRSCKDASASDIFKLSKGDVIKLGRLKFKVKDFRTDTVPACEDGSPIKGRKSLEPETFNEDGEFSEEAVEIDCGVVDSS